MSESFAELFEESLKIIDMKSGAIITGVVVDIDSEWVTVHAGLKSEGVIPRDQFLSENGELVRVVLPIHGYGLWSTLYGFVSLEGDANTIEGLGFYDHAETPGLGGEITNPAWVKTWQGKEVYGEDGNVQFEVVKGGAKGEHEVDALSGATLTSNGVEYLVQFWMGENGYGPLLKKLREGELNNG